MIFSEERMCKNDVPLSVFALVEVVHVELLNEGPTCRTKEDKLPCLKYCSSRTGKASSSVISKESPYVVHCMLTC